METVSVSGRLASLFAKTVITGAIAALVFIASSQSAKAEGPTAVLCRTSTASVELRNRL